MEENDFRKRLRVSIQQGSDYAEQLSKNIPIVKLEKLNIKEQITNKIVNLVEKEMSNITNNNKLTKDEKIDGLDLLWDVQKFLANYEKNVKILNDNNNKFRR